jgi:glycosyltransferase involved in cell wall biosynthesis
MAKQVIIAVTNDLVTDQRVSRIADTLLEEGYKITLVGRILPHSASLNRNYPIKRFKLLFSKGVLFYATYNIRLFFYLMVTRFDAVLSNDLDTLLASYMASKVKGKCVIYDSHEYFTEVPELVNRKFQQRAWESIERLIVPKLTYAYTVSGSIAAAYKKKYGTGFQVIRNLPTKKNFNEQVKENILLYQGALNKGRGIELMIKTMKFLPDYKLWIAGAGDIENELHALVTELHFEDTVIFLGRIPAQELYNYTIKAKLGLSFEEDLGLNYRYALPNKLFDYIQARIPVLVSDLPEMKLIVKKYKIGALLESKEPKVIANQINTLLNNSKEMELYQSNLKIAAQELCWENEKQKLLPIFDKALV